MNKYDAKIKDADALDRKAILDLIDAEHLAYKEKNFERMASFWQQTENSQRWSGEPGHVYQGWSSFSNLMRESMRRYPLPMKSKTERLEKQLRVNGDQAWFSCLECIHGDDVKYALHVLIVFERLADGWKIVCIVTIPAHALSQSVPMLSVDRNGRVLEMNDLAKTRLEDHSHLTVTNGFFRALQTCGASALKRALAEAPNILYCVDPNYEPYQQRGGKFPVMLGDVDAGDLSVCWLAPDVDTFLVTFDDIGSALRRVDMAKFVFGLSMTQTDVAKLIVEGLDIPEIATRLGVRNNTARTHLRRIYEKTGVSNRSSLVRVLLSVGGL